MYHNSDYYYNTYDVYPLQDQSYYYPTSTSYVAHDQGHSSALGVLVGLVIKLAVVIGIPYAIYKFFTTFPL